MHYWKNTWWFNYNAICNLQMQEPRLNCLPEAGASGLCWKAFPHLLHAMERIPSHPVFWGSQESWGWVHWPASAGASAAALDPMKGRNCGICGADLLCSLLTFLFFQLPEAARFMLNISGFTQKSWVLYYLDIIFYHSDYICQEISIHKHYPLCCCPLRNSSILLLFPAVILQQLSEMDLQAPYCAKPSRKNGL